MPHLFAKYFLSLLKKGHKRSEENPKTLLSKGENKSKSDSIYLYNANVYKHEPLIKLLLL